MTRVLVVYATTLGNTGRMAESVAEGVDSVPGAEAVLREAEAAGRDDARACDALVLGSPMRHRSADARVKRFIEDVLEQLWLTDEMVGKTGAVFTVGGGYGNSGAGVEIAQLGLLAAMAACGMVLVPFPKTSPGHAVAGSHWGPCGRSGGPRMEPVGISDGMRLAGFHHGANVARVAAALRGRELFARGEAAPPPDILAKFQQATG